MATFTAGDKINFTASCALAGEPRYPATMTLTVRATKSGVVTLTDYDMVLDETVYRYELDSTGYDRGSHAFVVSTDDERRAVRGGEFSIARNSANPF